MVGKVVGISLRSSLGLSRTLLTSEDVASMTAIGTIVPRVGIERRVAVVDKERDARLGTRGVVKSEADFDDVMERLQEQEMEDKKMHSYAVIPPLLLPPDERRRKFTNNNGLMRDPMQVHKEKEYVNMWT